MCTRPRKILDQHVACRTCDQCLEMRENTWVARAMAERSVAGQTLAVTLTYSDLPENGGKPTGATVFRYSDIQKFMKTLRENYFRKYEQRSGLSYIVCGERGSNGTQRIHWHIILFTNKPIGVLGEWVDFRTKEVVEKPVTEKNYDWSIWPHGHCKIQAPGERGIRYALKYAMKEQHTAFNSKQQNRYAKSHNWAAAKFMPSKKPPIGVRFLVEFLDRMEASQTVPPSINIRVPDYKGYWFLHGEFRKYALNRCHEINKAYRKKNGRDAPTWAALLKSVSTKYDQDNTDNQDQETLHYGEIEEPQTPDPARIERETEIAKQRARETAAGKRTARLVRNCTGPNACETCANFAQPDTTARNERRTEEAFTEYLAQFPDASPQERLDLYDAFETEWRRKKEIHPSCALYSDRKLRRAIKDQVAVERGFTTHGPVSEDTGRNARAKGAKPHRPPGT